MIIPSSCSYIGHNAFSGCSELSIFLEGGSVKATWEKDWNPDGRPVYAKGKWHLSNGFPMPN
jgi:hypothetical protein